jgi:hypothetical protein
MYYMSCPILPLNVFFTHILGRIKAFITFYHLFIFFELLDFFYLLFVVLNKLSFLGFLNMSNMTCKGDLKMMLLKNLLSSIAYFTVNNREKLLFLETLSISGKKWPSSLLETPAPGPAKRREDAVR